MIIYRIILILTTVFLVNPLLAENTPRKAASKGVEHYNKEEYDKAIAEFITGLKSDPKEKQQDQLSYDLGAALYKAGNFEEAAGWFSKAAKSALEGDKKLASDALYNLGNSYVQMQKLEEAANAYKYALKVDPKDRETKENLESVLRMMQMQPQEQQQQQDQEQEKQEQPDSTQQQQQKPQPSQQDSTGNQEPQPEPEPTDMSPEEAMDLLQALEADEQEAQKDKLERQFGEPKRTGKDW